MIGDNDRKKGEKLVGNTSYRVYENTKSLVTVDLGERMTVWTDRSTPPMAHRPTTHQADLCIVNNQPRFVLSS